MTKLKNASVVDLVGFLLVACFCYSQCCSADGGGDSVSFRGAGNALTTEGAGEGQVAVMGPGGKQRWMNQSALLRADYNVKPTVVHGATGWLAWSMPEQGAGYKKIVICFNKYTSPSPVTINFPVPFDRLAAVTASNVAGTNLVTLDTNSATIPSEASPADGVLVMEGI